MDYRNFLQTFFSQSHKLFYIWHQLSYYVFIIAFVSRPVPANKIKAKKTTRCSFGFAYRSERMKGNENMVS